MSEKSHVADKILAEKGQACVRDVVSLILPTVVFKEIV